MAEEKITELTAIILPAADDIMVIVDDISGTPVSKKMTHDDVLFGANGTPSTQAYGDSAAVGTALDAARSDHKHAIPASFVATGTYTGNDTTSQAITGVGFTVKFLWITKVYADNQTFNDKEMMFTSTTIIDDDAAGLAHSITAAAVITRHNAIIALGADGFTVDDDGADADPNANTIVYNYIAMG